MDYTLNMDKNISLLKSLQSIQTELKTLGIKCWLDYGQLLGAKRNGKLLSWDNDIDFGVLVNENIKVGDICQIITKHLNVPYDIQNSYTPFRVVSKFIKDNFLIDFYFFIEKDKYFHTPYSAKGGLDMRSFFYDELDQIKLENISFDCPRHLDLYLKIRYGDTWKTPIQKVYSFVKTNPGNIYQEKDFNCLTAGVFDLLHKGHIKLFERIKKEFDYLTIGIHNDETVQSYKRKPVEHQEKRYNKILELGIADKIIKNFPLVCNQEVLTDYDFVVFGREKNTDRFYPHDIKNHPIKRTENISTTSLIK